ncbi:glycine cleavage system T protein [Thermodesulfobium narugense DSM 14796]|uniref:aminomethyltransferase n=1 Tax=Thermodesulfobium narugense DSM 14796 TaxID=747365 RepID=M1E7T2_9BACT|nr:glycine cleavage system aminomethyltransferase GcvT [Thermodesulfobium narugense]AEE14773.1 glycine cleavage system T protein [Thermodesulfobium narugense DSM 14796]
MENLKSTPLEAEHIKLKAKMAPFGGWNMPIQYESIIEEHMQCRKSAALFDTCHMGEFYFKGDLANTNIEMAFSFKIGTINVGKCRYGLILNEKGGIVDDCIVYRLSADELMMVVNAGTKDNDFNVIKSVLKGNFIFEDRSETTSKLDVQGPLSRELLRKYFPGIIDELKYFSFTKTSLMNQEVILSRTGYTGELGFEIYMPSTICVDVWNDLLKDERIKPAGLGARDLLRLEMGYPLYGSDLDEDTTPLEADLSYFVHLDKDFVGKEALLKQKETELEKIRVGFVCDSRRAPRHGYKIFADGMDIGYVTSGGFSPSLGKGIGMGYVKPQYSSENTILELSQDRVIIKAVVEKIPFYKDGSLRK